MCKTSLALPAYPLTWQDEAEKFDRLTTSRIEETLCQQIKEAVHCLESIQVKDLMELLSRVQTK